MFPWFFWHGERHSSFSWLQALADGLAFFVFMFVIVFVISFGLLHFYPRVLISLAVFALVVGVFDGWYHPRKPST